MTRPSLKRHIAICSKPTPQPVAGYDLVFTPSKSISVLWGVGDDATRRAIEGAHRRAVTDALGYLEDEALYTRRGTAGIEQVNAKGIVAAAFDHYDSRSGDPNFHTHVAVANKVQGPDGRWRSIDGRVLHAAAVSSSERYNAVLERETRPGASAWRSRSAEG
ncbi:relaxase domain-containing protein [Nocardioides sp. W3-2-3]|nr:relaxase domain-containing protein [Nocardioides convexus]